MIGALTIVVGLTGLALFAWHMVRPNFRDLRISMAEFLPDLPDSTAPRNRVSLVPPVGSLPFVLRMFMLAAVVAALWSYLFPPPPNSTDLGPVHLRIIVDMSPSMGLADDRAGAVQSAVDAVAAHMASGAQDACLDLALVGDTTTLVPWSRTAQSISGSERAKAGVPASAFLAALSLASRTSGCIGPPSMATVISDLPPMPITQAIFPGPLVWWQLGDPLPNVALETINVTGGGLGGAGPILLATARSYGGAGSKAPRIRIETPNSETEGDMRPDLSRAGVWTLEVPFQGAGPYHFALLDGGLFGGDDRLSGQIRDLKRPAFDWRLTSIALPAAFADGEASGILVAALGTVPVPTDRPAILTYDGWSSAQPLAQIGTFVQDDPLLQGVNFDVLETNLPTGQFDLPPGFEAVLMSDQNGGTPIIATRADPPAIILPSPIFDGSDRQSLSFVLFGNALRLVAGSTLGDGVTFRHVDASGTEFAGALYESDTARALTDPPDLSTLDAGGVSAAEGSQTPEEIAWVPWLLALALTALVAERLLGVAWRPTA